MTEGEPANDNTGMYMVLTYIVLTFMVL